MDRSHKGEVQCTGIITLACLIFELVPFVVFHTWILSGACPSFTTWGKTGVSCNNLPLLFLYCEHNGKELSVLKVNLLDAFLKFWNISYSYLAFQCPVERMNYEKKPTPNLWVLRCVYHTCHEIISITLFDTCTHRFLCPRIERSGVILFYRCPSDRLSVCTNLTWKLHIFPLLLN